MMRLFIFIQLAQLFKVVLSFAVLLMPTVCFVCLPVALLDCVKHVAHWTIFSFIFVPI